MWKRLVIGVGLVVLILAGVVLADRWTLPPDPPLRAGMSVTEVDELLKENGCGLAADSYPRHRIYEQGPVGFGSEKRRIVVNFDNGRLRHWEFESFLPTWMGRQGKSDGW